MWILCGNSEDFRWQDENTADVEILCSHRIFKRITYIELYTLGNFGQEYSTIIQQQKRKKKLVALVSISLAFTLIQKPCL